MHSWIDWLQVSPEVKDGDKKIGLNLCRHAAMGTLTVSMYFYGYGLMVTNTTVEACDMH